jgi:nitric oxide reductase subunit B
MDVQDQLAMFYWIRLGSGVFVLISALMFLWALFVPGKARNPSVAATVQPAE